MRGNLTGRMHCHSNKHFQKLGKSKTNSNNTCPHVPGEAAATPESRLLE